LLLASSDAASLYSSIPDGFAHSCQAFEDMVENRSDEYLWMVTMDQIQCVSWTWNVFESQHSMVLLLPVNSNESLLQELSIALLKNTRQILFEGCFESSKFLLTTVVLESSFNFQSI
jgi:hypothetical protein